MLLTMTETDGWMNGEGGPMNDAGTFNNCHHLAVDRNSFC